MDTVGCACWPRRAESEKPLKPLSQQSADRLVEIARKKMATDAKYRKARQRAWTGKEDQKQVAYKIGEKAYAQNPHYEDGTRLRSGPRREDDFNGAQVLNDAEVLVVEVADDFAKVRVVGTGAEDEPEAEGWLRQRNLSRARSRPGMLGASERRIGLGKPPRASAVMADTKVSV